MLDQEVATFVAQLPALLCYSTGQWALVRGTDIALFDTERDAIAAGRLAYGLSPFLVRQVAVQQLPPRLRLVAAHELN